MRIWIMIIILLIAIESASANLLITGIMYDPAGSDSGHEWVEIYNPTDSDISLSRYYFESGNGISEDNWNLEFNGTGIIKSREYFLIGEADVIPAPDYATNLDLQNGPDGFRIRNDTGIIDTLGWGNLEFPEYYEKSPAVDAGDGIALIRRRNSTGFQDTKNNSEDFYAAPAIPHSSSSGRIDIEVNVIRDDLIFSDLVFPDEDLLSDGFQISPVPDRTRDIEISFRLNRSDYASIDAEIIFENSTTAMHRNGSLFTGTIHMNYTMKAGEYSAAINVSDGSSSNSTQISFEYLTLSAIDFDTDSISFSDMKRNSISVIAGDFLLDTKDKPTIKNIGNTKIDLGIIGVDFRGEKEMFDVGSLSYTLDKPESDEISGSVKPTLDIVDLNLNPGESASLSLALHIPGNATAGAYDSNAAFLAVAS